MKKFITVAKKYQDAELMGEFLSVLIKASERYGDKPERDKLRLAITMGKNKVKDILRNRQRYFKMFAPYPENETIGDDGGIAKVESQFNMSFLKSKLNERESHVFVRITSGYKINKITREGYSRRSIYRILHRVKELYNNI